MSHTFLVASTRSPRLDSTQRGVGNPKCEWPRASPPTKQGRLQSTCGAPTSRNLRVRIHDIDVRSLRDTDVRNTDI